MNRWIMAWLRSWKDERFVVSSPLSVEDVRRRLEAGLTPRRRVFARSLLLVPGSPVVLGRVGEDDVKLVAIRPGVRNSWRPVLRGQLVATASGCQLACRLGWSAFVRVFSVFWLGMVTLVFLISALTAVGCVLTGHVRAAGGPAAGAGMTLGFVLFFVGLTAYGRRLSRDEVVHLRIWLAERLQSQG